MLKSFILPIIALALVCSAEAVEKKRYILYATFLEDTPVELSDGARWMMDRGDSFPVVMFKEQQTKVVLQLAGTTFMTPTNRVAIVEGDKTTPEMIANYRKNVQGYVEKEAQKLRKDLRAEKSKP